MYEDRDIRTNPQFVRELAGQYNSRSTPTTVIGDQVIIGFDPERIEEAFRE